MDRYTKLVREFGRFAAVPGKDTPETTEVKRQRRLVVWVAYADTLHGNDAGMRPAPMMERPADLPHDMLLRATIRAVALRGEKAAPADIEIVRSFVLWRDAVLRAEEISASRLCCVFTAIFAYETVGEECAGRANDMRRLVGRRFSAKKLPRPLPGNVRERDRIARDMVRRDDVLPSYLLNTSRTPTYGEIFSPAEHRTSDHGDEG